MKKTLAVIAIFLLSISARAEVGVELGFIFKCVENSSLSVTQFIGTSQEVNSDKSIFTKSSQASCLIGEYKYTVSMNVFEPAGIGCGGGQSTLFLDLKINEKQIIQSSKFSNACTNSLEKLEIIRKRGINQDKVTVCGESLYGSAYPYVEIKGCVSLDVASVLSQDQSEIMLADPINSFLTSSQNRTQTSHHNMAAP